MVDAVSVASHGSTGENDKNAERSENARLLILSNCRIFRTGLATALAHWPFHSVEAADVSEAETLDASDWDILLFDVPSDAKVDEHFQKLLPLRGVPYVVLTELFSFDVYAASLRHNASGYFVKDTPLSALQVALLLVLEGKKVFPTRLAQKHFSTQCFDSYPTRSKPSGTAPRPLKLSQQEMKILAFLVEGDCNKIIARRLGNTEATVKVQMKALFRKLGLQNRTQAAVWAVKNGYEGLSPGPFPMSRLRIFEQVNRGVVGAGVGGLHIYRS